MKTYYRKSKTGKWNRVHYTNIHIGDVIRTRDTRYKYFRWVYFKCTDIIDGEVVAKEIGEVKK